ncbi:hypothetical protein [Streptomyces sp. NBC_00576]|uniref:hypothetical protein n=1 Tax=Streptomyces sp. NBC_00576 TaxID=2903665 RepID=UPI002E8010B5|nr:hypothetical protein [Streptomyces sp. NBC_00576]WUB73111.1 hypothetical protein OG734_25170 [Streptomyces sp. NBC_00576]
MAWRDRLRRRAAADRSGVSGDGPSDAGQDRGAPGDPSPSAPAAPGSSLPGDWDGGWRRTAAPELTVSRAPLGVSDGLAFRAGLAAWQNPSFDSGLGHALLPAAPTGLVRGVTRPAASQPTHTAGGPLLLRALRPEGAHGSGDGTLDGPTAARTPQAASRTGPRERKSGSAASGSSASAVRPSGSGTGDNPTAGEGRSGGGAPRSRGLTSSDSPAVLSSSPASVQRAVEPGASPAVAPADTGHQQPVVPRTPLVRRVAVVVPPAAPGGAAPRPASGANSGRTSATWTASGGRTSSGPAVQRAVTEATGPQPEASRTSGADGSHPAVRLSPSGPRLTVARRPAGPARRIAAVRPANPPAPDTAPTPDASATTTPASTTTGSTAPVQRTATPARSRAPLGAPLSELPSTATPLTQSTPASGTGSAPGPTLPVVQRQADTSGAKDSGTGGTSGTGATSGTSGTGATKRTAPAAQADAPRRTPAPAPGPGSTGARARGGLGAPLPALPPSAELPGSAAPRASRTTTPGPDVQRAPVRPGQSSATAPVPPTGAAPLAPGADAPLLGTADVQRSLADHSTTGGTTKAVPADHANGPATPLVTPPPAVAPVATEGAAGKERRPAAAPGGASAGGPGSGGSRVDGSRADGPTSGRPRADAPSSRRQRPQHSAASGPVVVARAVTAGTAGTPGTARTRPAGSAGARPLTVTSSAAHSATTPHRTLSLLAARPLTLTTRTPEGAAPPAAARSGSRPVVAARWPGAPGASQGDTVSPTAPPTGAPARRFGTPAASPGGSPGGFGAPTRPALGPSAPTQATPQLQRATTSYPGPQGKDAGVRTTASPAPVQRVPVVRPAPPRLPTAGATAAVPAKPLPVTAPQAPPLADRPSAATAPGGPVPVVRPRSVTAAGGTGGTGEAALAVQRDARGRPRSSSAPPAPPTGALAKEVPAPGRKRSSSVSSVSSEASESSAASESATSSAASGKNAARRTETRQDDPGPDLDDLARRLLDPVSRLMRIELRRDPGLDLDDLSRRLLDPVARLLRTELRRGRDRTGRPYDGRR